MRAAERSLTTSLAFRITANRPWQGRTSEAGKHKKLANNKETFSD